MPDLTALAAAPRLLIEARLEPVQTQRFQPTGFPDLGAATYSLADGTEMLLVESAQSMANRLEAACWDEAAFDLVPPLAGLPYVAVDVFDGKTLRSRTATVLEAHRLNSPYVTKGMLDKRPFGDVLEGEADAQAGKPIDRARFVRTVLRYDPASLLHGVFMSNLSGGRLRLARALGAFIEARGVSIAQSGGVKNDRVNPSGATGEGYGNVPFVRTEYTAEEITAFFNLDLRQLRSFGLPEEVTRLLHLLALYKICRLTSEGMRLRTACDLDVTAVNVTAPAGFNLPAAADVAAELPEAIRACAPHFAKPAATRLRFQQTKASSKASRKAETAQEDQA